MAVATEELAVKVLNVSAGTPIPCNFPLYDETEVYVYYGDAALLAVYNTDYTVTLDAPNFDTFIITPTASLIAKIDALIVIDPTEINFVTIRRELDLLTATTPASVRNTSFTSREFDRTAMRFQQLAERLNRSVALPPTFVGDTPLVLYPGGFDQLATYDILGNIRPLASPLASELSSLAGVAAGRALVYPAAPAAAIYDAGNRKIGNLAAPTLGTDVAHKTYVDAQRDAAIAAGVADVNKLGYVSAMRYNGAVYDGTPGDQALIKAAALYAIAQDLPFIVPHKGLPAGGLDFFVGVDANIPTAQEAFNAMRSWQAPRFKVDPTAPYASPYMINIVQPADEVVYSGKGLVVPLPKGGIGDVVLLKGQSKTSLTFNSFVSQAPSAGLVLVTLQFTTALPAGIAAGDYLSTLITDGAGEHHLIRGMHIINSVDVALKRITIVLNAKGATSIAGLNVTSGTFYYIPSVLRYINMPFDGNDRGCIEVQENCTVNIKDIGLSGNASGTNAVSTNGIVLRKGASVRFEQHVGIYGMQRNGVWGVEAAEALLSYGMISYCDAAINMISGSTAIFDYGVATGNINNQLVAGIGSTISGAPMTVGGGLGVALYALNNGQIITSYGGGIGRVTTSGHGAVGETGGIVHLNDIPVVACTVGAAARPGSSVFKSPGGVFTANGTDYKPALNTPTMGAIVSDNWASDL